MRELFNRLWLCEPEQLQLAIYRAVTIRPCPTPREVAVARKERMEEAGQATSRAIAGTGRDDPKEAAQGGKTAVRAQKGRTAIIPVHGPLQQRRDGALEKAGGTAVDEISFALSRCLEDNSVSAILMHVDSPGGDVAGIQELADKIMAARAHKPIYAVADSMAASAAFWLATSASHFSVTPGGLVGSVGVYSAHADESQALENEGVKVTLVSAGKYKTEMSPFGPLSDDARAELQSRVDIIYGRFIKALATNRGVSADHVRREFGQGRVVDAEEAVKRGMADRADLSFEQLLARLTGTGATQNGASAQMARLRQDQLRWHQEKRKLISLIPQQLAGPGLTHDSKTQSSEPRWSSVDKTKLPDNAFADQEDRSYPHHWVQNGGKPDDDGRYTTGSLWLHREGLNSAWAAANGARSGDQASQAVKDHLQAHRKALGLDDNK